MPLENADRLYLPGTATRRRDGSAPKLAELVRSPPRKLRPPAIAEGERGATDQGAARPQRNDQKRQGKRARES